MNRKQFVLLGMGGVAAVSVPSYLYFFGDVEYDRVLAEPQSLSLIWDSKTVRNIGDLYRMQNGAENSDRTLVNLLAPDGLTGEQLKSKVEEKVKGDFIAGETVLVDGWILSKTEARQCALFSTSQLQ